MDFSEIDMRKDGLPKAVLKNWLERYGLENLLNRRSTTWRNLDPETKAKLEKDPETYITENPTLLHRPILDFGDQLLNSNAALKWLESA